MKFWNQYPILRILIPLMLGVLTAWYFPLIKIHWLIYFIAIVLLIVWVYLPKSHINYRFRFFGSSIVLFVFFLSGLFLTQSHQEQFNQLHYSNKENVSHFLVRIDAPFTSTQKSHKTIGKVLGVKTHSDSCLQASYGKLLLYFQKKDSLIIQYGDEIVINANNLNVISNMGNPHEFDYQTYLKRHQIFHQLYLIPTDWLKTEKRSANILLEWSYIVRDRLIAILNSYQFSEENFAVASAILIGYDEYLDQDLRQLYAGSGAMHILCVSGLHVGIIFLILNVLLMPLQQHKSSRIFKAILISLMIWFYALITGMSPSVFRAATMFSFISFGQMINRRTSVYNSLAASAVVLIISDPLVIFHIGFQLSYSAILGILLIQPIISSWVSSRNMIVRYFWDLIAVSIAAQIGTFPISIYYFHQFPNYFILTNLFVIPASFIILTTGFATLAIDLIGLSDVVVFNLAKRLLELLLSILNKGIDLINQLPNSVSHELFFTQIEVWYLYVFLGLIIGAILQKKKSLIFVSVISFIVFMLFNGIVRINNFNNTQEVLTFYHIPNNGLLELKKGNTSMILLDSLLLSESQYSRYIVENMLNKRIKKKEILLIDSLIKEPHRIEISDWSMIVYGKNTRLPRDKSEVDYLWVRNNPKKNPILILEKIKPKTVIFDASNSFWKTEDWEEICDQSEICFHDVRKKGALIVKAP